MRFGTLTNGYRAYEQCDDNSLLAVSHPSWTLGDTGEAGQRISFRIAGSKGSGALSIEVKRVEHSHVVGSLTRQVITIRSDPAADTEVQPEDPIRVESGRPIPTRFDWQAAISPLNIDATAEG